MANTTDVRVEEKITISHALSWQAILAGVVVALVVQLLLAILGGALGLASVDPTSSSNPSGATAGVVAAIWWTLSGVLAAGAGGITAGRLCGRPASGTAAWHGLVTWAVTTLIVFYLLATAVGGILGRAFKVIGSVAGAAGQSASAVAPKVAASVDPFASVETELNDAFGVKDLDATRSALAGFVRTAFTSDPSNSQSASDRAATALANATGMTPDQAKQKLTDLKAEYDKAVAQAKQQAADAANAARQAAVWAGVLGVIALVLGAVAGWFGGWYSPRPPENESPSTSRI